MKKVKVIKLGTVCKDKATELTGTLTHWGYNMSGHIQYILQPKALGDDGQPVDSLCLEEDRLIVKKEEYELIEIPDEILGSIVTDRASGFTGMAVNFMRHINGCFHVYIQPSGLNAKTNQPIRRADFDLRSCEGEKIKNPQGKKLEESKKKEPSPSKLKNDFDQCYKK
jgi:hypothetical protein